MIVDDHLLVADSLASALAASDRIDVVAVAATCAEGAAAVGRLNPTVCLLDQRLPDGTGTDLIPRLRAASPDTKVVLVTGDDSVDVLRLALEAGATGVVNKGRRARALLDAVLHAAEGTLVLAPEDVLRLLPTPGGGLPALGHDLTPREREVLRLLVRARSTREIAAELVISHATARNHIQAVITKLGAHTKLEAVTIAVRENIVSGP
ncbi:response regulator [Phycicoccus flavus]|uniref:response regulator n=1 Tax=Phycicoccus flavus TaxID=2502783 RepID=UPI0013E35D0E|nr:response regulator transcription factor [Phycicoccus flavus]